MVEWMGRNFDVFPSFQQIPCYVRLCVIKRLGVVQKLHGLKKGQNYVHVVIE